MSEAAGASGDDPLLRRAQAGDQPAMQELLLRNLPRLEAYLRLQAGAAIRRKESISDLVQSVCIEVLRDLPRFEFRGEAPFRQWLMRHALHKLINKREFHGAARRDLAREVEAEGGSDSSGGLLACYATLGTPSRAASAREEIERFEAAVDTLPPDYREAVLMRRVLELDYPEIAAAMERSEGAVRNLVHRGLARLSTLLRVEE